MKWPTLTLEDIASVQRGKFSARPRNDPKYYGGDIPFIQTGDIANSSGHVRSYSQTLNDAGLAVSKLFPKGSLAITIAANIGDVAKVDFDFACPDSLVVIQPNKNVCTAWLMHCLQSKKVELESLAPQNAQKNINLEALRPLALDVPPEREQQRIAIVLDTWDDAIEKTERLIAVKERRNEALSNQLLFGKWRLGRCDNHTTQTLHWFSMPGDWHIVEIGQIAREISETNGGGKDLPVLSCTKYDGLVDSLKYFDKRVFSHDTSKYKVVRRGQFAYATNHIEEGSIGYQDLAPAGLVSPIYTVFQADPAQIDDGYLFKLLKTEKLRQLFAAKTNASVDRRGSLRWKEFARIHIPLPPIEEQQQISAVLDEAKREITLLQAKAAALKAQKRGLMQKLLTGQWRLKPSNPEAAAP